MDWWIVVMIVLIVAVIAIFILLKYHARDPPRKISAYNDIVSPADGRIIEILPFDHTDRMTIEKTISKVIAHSEDVAVKGVMVTIYTKWNSIHYNRMPITGTIHKWRQVQGKNFSPRDSEALIANTRTEMVIEGTIKLKVIQVAGNFLSAIKNFAKPGQTLQKGAKFGNISMASQTVLIIPDSARLKVKEGQEVSAGQTSIADFQTEQKTREGLLG